MFQKRHSLNEASITKQENDEIDKLKSSFEISNTSEKNQQEHILDDETKFVDSKQRTPEEDFNSMYEYLETEDCDSKISCETVFRRNSAPPAMLHKFDSGKLRTVSCNENQQKPIHSTAKRKKCVSESNAYDIKSIENRTLQGLVQVKENPLENMIGRYVNKLIKESIITAVKSVDVEKICEEVMNNVSEFGNTLNIGQEKHSEKGEDETCNESAERMSENTRNCDQEIAINSPISETNFKDNVIGSTDQESASLDGYTADLEESMSLHSTDLDSKVENVENKSSIITKSEDFSSDTELTSKCLEHDLEIHEDENGAKDRLESDNLNANCVSASCEKQDNSSYALLKTEKIDESISFKEKDNSKQLVNVIDDELNTGKENKVPDLILISPENDALSVPNSETVCPETRDSSTDLALIPQQPESRGDEKKHNWKVGYLHVKLPHKTRSKSNLKAWKKRCVSFQPDEFVHDPKNHSLMISVYSAESGSARKHGASFWKSISCQKAVVYRSSSRTHKYAFTISDDNKVVIHLAGDSEATSQDWISAIRSILWPPSPVVQLEKMLYGKEFEISIIDNDFSLRAGLLGMYGYLTITRKKLILVHPQQGFVIQEWYLNTIDKFELIHQPRIEDVHKVLSMTTCSDSSTGKGELLMFCTESIAMLQAIASTIHQILTEHTKQGGGKYEKELAEMADWLIPPANNTGKETSEDYYKVPPRQVKSLLDIPNFIFNKPLAVVESGSCSADENTEKIKSADLLKSNPTRASQDSGISAGNPSEDILNCSSASFIVGGRNMPGKSSDSELSDSYTPPRTPETKSKRKLNEKLHSNTSLHAT